MSWAVEGTDQMRGWYDSLGEEDQDRINAAVELLEERGPTLGRPIVAEVAGTKVHNLKELRPLGSAIRILFAFDPRRTAILLLGGNKAGEWNRWYRGAIPQAIDLYQAYLEELRREGHIK